LTRREQQVLKKVMLGLSNKVIAAELLLQEGTVKSHVKSILRKLGVVSRTQAGMLAQRRGLVVEDGAWPRRSRTSGANAPGLHSTRTSPDLAQPSLRRDADILGSQHFGSVPLYGRCGRDLHLRGDDAQRRR
jgi:DNA-binding CsgD family transcriptional regulator